MQLFDLLSIIIAAIALVVAIRANAISKRSLQLEQKKFQYEQAQQDIGTYITNAYYFQHRNRYFFVVDYSIFNSSINVAFIHNLKLRILFETTLLFKVLQHIEYYEFSLGEHRDIKKPLLPKRGIWDFYESAENWLVQKIGHFVDHRFIGANIDFHKTSDFLTKLFIMGEDDALYEINEISKFIIKPRTNDYKLVSEISSRNLSSLETAGYRPYKIFVTTQLDNGDEMASDFQINSNFRPQSVDENVFAFFKEA